jgi:pilus assembly protein FimV
MKSKKFTSIAAITALGVLLPITQGHAFGLGKIELSSALNQPFKATIPVTALRDDEKGNLQVQLASYQEFERAGIERNYYLTQFTFDVVETNGKTVIQVSSKNVVKEPFIDFLITATTGNGRLIREYTVLLDPPKHIFDKTPKTAVTVESQVKPVVTKTAESVSQVNREAVANTSSSYGPTDRNDTLWKIAVKTKPTQASVHQMMMALLNENPSAFVNNNINGLKAGQTLAIPSVEGITSLSQSQAISAVAEQNLAWKNRNTAKQVAVTTVSNEKKVVSEQPAVSSNQLATETAESTARLKLVSPTESTNDNPDITPLGDTKLTELTEQLTLAQETIENQTQENIDIKARMEAMEE